jgi:hypothetical protein
MFLCFGLAMALCNGTAGISLAQGLGALGSLTGKGGGNVDINALAEKQSTLSKRLQAALIEINGAQAHFAEALGDKEQADKLRAQNDSLSKGNTNDEALVNAVALSTNVGKIQGENLKKIGSLNEKQKQEIQKGILPYSKGTAHTALLAKEFAEHLKATQSAISKASLANAAQIKNKLGLTLSLAPKMPGLGTTHFETASTLIKTAKSNNLKVDEANKVISSMQL